MTNQEYAIQELGKILRKMDDMWVGETGVEAKSDIEGFIWERIKELKGEK